jgi:hypothetical protein
MSSWPAPAHKPGGPPSSVPASWKRRQNADRWKGNRARVNEAVVRSRSHSRFRTARPWLAFTERVAIRVSHVAKVGKSIFDMPSHPFGAGRRGRDAGSQPTCVGVTHQCGAVDAQTALGGDDDFIASHRLPEILTEQPLRHPGADAEHAIFRGLRLLAVSKVNDWGPSSAPLVTIAAATSSSSASVSASPPPATCRQPARVAGTDPASNRLEQSDMAFHVPDHAGRRGLRLLHIHSC